MIDQTPQQIADEVRNAGEVLHRAADMAEAYDAEKRTLTLAFVSETPVERWYGMEILSCDPEDVDMGRLRNKAPLLMHHDPTFQIGVIQKATVDADKVGRAVAKLSKRKAVEAIAEDIADGIVSKVSVGYELIDAKEDVREVDDKGEPTGKRTIKWRWRPLEISLVSVPADDRVGIGRSRGGQDATKPANVPAVAETVTEVRAMENTPKEMPAATVNAAEERANERARINAIRKLGAGHNMNAEADKAIDSGKSADEFRAEVLAAIERRQAAAPKPEDTTIGMSPKETRRYSFLRAIQSLAGEPVDAGFERECSDEVARKLGRPARGMFIPMEARAGIIGVSGSLGTGGQTVATDLLADSFIELLRKRLAVVDAGATMLTGLNGNVAIPKQSAASTAYWVAENSAATISMPTLTQVTGSPKTVGAYTDITRKLLLQSSMDVEALIRGDLAAVLARAIDVAALHGTGASNQPTGIVNTSDVTEVSVTQDAPTYAQIVAFPGAIMADNADIGAMKWLMPAGVWEKLATTLITTTYGDRHILDASGPRTLLGYDYAISNQVADGYLFLGVWSQLVIGMWGALDITADRSQLQTVGGVRVVALQDVDIMVRHPQAFAFGKQIANTNS